MYKIITESQGNYVKIYISGSWNWTNSRVWHSSYEPLEVEIVKSSANAFSPNDRINHSIYGLGTISEVNDLHTVIEFDENGRRKFVTSIVRMERTDIVAPARPSRKGRSKTVKSKTKAVEN